MDIRNLETIEIKPPTQRELAEKLLIELGASGWHSLVSTALWPDGLDGYYKGREWYEALNIWVKKVKYDLPDRDANQPLRNSPGGLKVSAAVTFNRHVAMCEKYADKSPFIAEDSDGHTLMWAIRVVSRTLNPREAQVLFLRFGLTDRNPRTLREMADLFGITRSRVQQITHKVLRKLRHPNRFHHFRPFLYQYDCDDERAGLARYELHMRLSKVYPMSFSYNLVMRLRRRYLADALKAVNSSAFRQLNRLVAYSCSLQMGTCDFCGEAALPSSNWCLTHLDLNSKVVVICDGCGIKFARIPGQLTSYTRKHGRTQHAVFHDRKCFFKHADRLGLWDKRKAKIAVTADAG